MSQVFQKDNKISDEIKVQFFGNFQVTLGGRLLTESSSRTNRPWSLLQFLLLNQHKSIGRQQLLDVMWPEDESAQPEKALKNLVYRLRTLLLPLREQFGQEAILCHNSSYRLNPNLPWVLDFEEFEKHCSSADNPHLPFEQKLKSCQSALDLYRGEFLSEHTYEEWVLPYTMHFRCLYLKCIQQAIPLFEQANCPETAEYLCVHALAKEKFEEPIHLAYLQLLDRQGKQHAAAAHYENMADMFFQELGVTPGEELRAMYNNLIKTSNRLQMDLTSIKESISEKTPTKSVFFCDYEVFRHIYRLEERSAERGGQSVFLCLITLIHNKTDQLQNEMLHQAMELLLECLHKTLRRGDVAARFSQTQYVLMLPTITLENGTEVMRRVAEVFQHLTPHKALSVSTKIQPLTPLE